MDANQAAGVTTFLLAGACFVAAFPLHARGRRRLAVGALVAGGLLLRAFASGDFFLHDWDERFHALVAKNLRAHPLRPTLYDDPLLPYDYRDWAANHVWLHKPPLTLWVMAGSLGLFGVNELAVRLPSLVVSLAGIVLTYRLGALLFEPRVGLFAGLLHALSGFLIDRAAGRQPTDHVDTLFVFLVEAGVWLAVLHVRRPRASLAAGVGALTGLAILTKWLAALVVPAVWMVMLSRTGRRPRALHAVLALAAATLVGLPWQVYARLRYPAEFRWERAYELRHLFEPLEGHTGSLLFHLAWMGRFHGELVYLPLAWFLYRAARESDWAKLGVAAWFGLPYLFFSLVATKMWGYVMIAAPALFLIQGWYWWRLRAWMAARDGRRGVVVLLALLLVLPARYSVERVRPFSRDLRTRPWAERLKQIDRGRCVLFNEPRPIEAMFYSRCVAYSSLVAPDEVPGLRRRGYLVLLWDDGRLPPALAGHPDVELLPLAGD